LIPIVSSADWRRRRILLRRLASGHPGDARTHPRVDYRQADCSDPERLFDPQLLAAEPHPWLVVEDAHHNVGAVLEHFHKYLSPGDYLVVEDSDVKRETLRRFVADHPGAYLVDTRFTDNFGRNATCAADSIFIRTPAAAEPT
jgi:cephalosporin hydroxylase